MSTYAQHEHGEETEKLQPENSATEASQATRHSAVISPHPRRLSVSAATLPMKNRKHASTATWVAVPRVPTAKSFYRLLKRRSVTSSIGVTCSVST